VNELERIAAAEEIELTVGGGRPVTIWVVRVGDELYIRSYRGAGAAWYRRAQAHGEGRISAGGVERDVALVESHDADDAVDDAYYEKYGRNSYAAAMVTEDARATTLRVESAAQ
jgi:hypothetical protein